jgi:hypothetical protein
MVKPLIRKKNPRDIAYEEVNALDLKWYKGE